MTLVKTREWYKIQWYPYIVHPGIAVLFKQECSYTHATLVVHLRQWNVGSCHTKQEWGNINQLKENTDKFLEQLIHILWIPAKIPQKSNDIVFNKMH